MTINHRYWKQDRKCHHARQAEKEALESHSWKQGRTSTSDPATASQNKANLFPAASSAKNSFSKSSLSPAPKKQPNTPWVDLSSKLASNGKLTSDECKKCLKNNVTNFIQLVSPQPVDRFSQTKLHWKAPNEGYPHICGMYKSNNKRLRYQAISSCKSFVC